MLLAAVELSLLWSVPASAVARAGYAGPTPVAVAVVCLGTLPVVARRRFPLRVFALVAAGAAGAVFLSVPMQGYGVMVALYTVAAYGDRRGALATAGVTLAGTTAAMLAVDALPFLPIALLVLTTAWILGDRQRTRRAYTSELEDRAARLEQEREDRARLAVAEERSRIARELYDVVAHSVSAMVVQAAAARRTLDRNPALAGESLGQVEVTGRQVLGEMRRLLGLLPPNGDGPELAPQPGVAQLDEVVDRIRAAGLEVVVTIEGRPRPLPSGIDLSVHRIVEEALTNVLEHAGPVTRASVSLSYDVRALRLEVADDGRGPVPGTMTDNAGHGLVSVRERVAVLGGSLHVGARPGGGFVVRAVLPLDGAGISDAVRGGAG